jgi:hypothetical protein
MESGLPSMDSKDVEDIFKGVLVEEQSQETLFHITPGVQPPHQQLLPRPRPPVPTPSSALPPAIIPSPVGPPCKLSRTLTSSSSLLESNYLFSLQHKVVQALLVLQEFNKILRPQSVFPLHLHTTLSIASKLLFLLLTILFQSLHLQLYQEKS